MLSRVADHLYWMSRYLERAEHTARLVDVSLYHLLDQKSDYAVQRWKRLLDSLRITTMDELMNDSYSVVQSLTFDESNAASIVSCISRARDNARQVREHLSTEMWEHLNRLFLRIHNTSMDDIWFTDPHEFLVSVKEGAQFFQGLTDSLMTHNEGWHFIRVGRFIERTWATAALIDVHFRTSSLSTDTASGENTLDDLEYLEWVGLLRSCSAFEAYCRVYTANNISPEGIAEFLLLNAESPRSIRFASVMMQGALQAIAKVTRAPSNLRVERLVGRLRSTLEYDQIEDIFDDIHSYLAQIQRQCDSIQKSLFQTYISYPIDVAIVSEGAAQS